MPAQRGRDMLIKLRDGNGVYITIAGLRSKTLRLGAKVIDITHSESADAWQELLPGAGIKSAEISGAGVFRNDAAAAHIRSAFFQQSAADLKIIIPGFGEITGPFLITGLIYGGQYDGEASYEITVQAAGALSFAAA